MKILILGAQGVLGSQLTRLFNEKRYITKYEILSPTKSELDLRSFDQVNEYMGYHQPDLIIGCQGKSGWREDVPNATECFENILMFDNVARTKPFDCKLINFGTGGEFDRTIDINNHTSKRPAGDFYGFAKRVISTLARQYNFVYNLRLYGCFGAGEDSNRFIKKSIVNYINQQPITIIQDKKFSYFYIKDLFTIINKIIENQVGYNSFDLVYTKEVYLSDIANIINNLDKHKVEIIIENPEIGRNYIGNPYYENYFNQITLDKQFDLMGLDDGIADVYSELTVPF